MPIELWALEQPHFSVKHGLYESPFNLSITSDNTTTIYYSLDSSSPTEVSNKYENPIEITKTTVVKAIAIDEDGNCSSVATSTYIFPEDVVWQSDEPEGYPSTWGEFITIEGYAPADYGMDPLMAEDEYLKEKIIKGLYQLPIVSVSGDKKYFFSHELDSVRGGIYIYTGVTRSEKQLGRGWERPVSFELFDGLGDEDCTINCGIKIHGGNSRIPECQPKHSFRLHFKSKYGASKLNYPLFGEDGPSVFNDVIIRSFYNNSWTHGAASQRTRAQYIRDLWIRIMQKKLGHPSSSGRYCHLFLNGMYWGLYCLSERITGDYCKNNFGGKKSEYDVIKVDEWNHIEVADGNPDEWNRMMQMLNDYTEPNQLYEVISEILDIDNFIDYMILNQYVGNTDWDRHNWIAFKLREGGKFKFVCWDSETIFGNLEDDVTNLNITGCPSSIFMKLISSESFLNHFSERANKLLSAGGALSPDNVVEVWDSLYSQIELAIYAEAARWGDYRKTKQSTDQESNIYTVDNQYIFERNRLLFEYFPFRTSIYRNQLVNKNWLTDTETSVIIPMEKKLTPHIYDLRGNVQNINKIKKGTIYIYEGRVFIKH